ncbi:MAG: uroporphyrinogen-III C-methyltransferase [Gammaproteobacteria bacterium]|nr:uroporphyrinogen-III C-methyltransferase [Gammaproteobacteria bacterium]MCY4338903.1 uroporphyrinogen-III C-methyltransferase [Gammaproteobacteria bacterium]
MNDKTDATAAEQVPEQAARADGEATATEMVPADETAAPDASAGADAAQSIPDPKPGGRWFATLLLWCLIVAAIGAGGYFIYDLRQNQAAERAEQEAIAHKLDSLQRSQALLGESLSQLADRQDRADEQLRALQQHLGTLRRQLSHASGWQLEEIQHLLRVASQRLTLAGDVDTALAALHAVDTRLREIPDAALIPVRERLIRDLHSLQAYPRTDFSGAALALADLAARARQLPLRVGAGTTPAPTREQIEQPPRWQYLLGNIWQELKSLVVITRNSGQAAALLAPSEQFFLHRNLRLQLEAARVALLARDEDQYRTSIQAATDWLREFFDPDDAGVRSALKILQDTATLELNPPLPSLDSTLSAFAEYLLRQDGTQSYRGAP